MKFNPAVESIIEEVITPQSMVAIQQADPQLKRRSRNRLGSWIVVVSAILALLMALWITALAAFLKQQQASSVGISSKDEGHGRPSPPPPQQQQQQQQEFASCPVTSISSLSDAELHPVTGTRHMVTPPDGGRLTLVCCSTTKGHLSVLLHENWAPIGVGHLLEMVRSGYFQTKIPLFRCSDACQFGLSGDPNVTKQYDHRRLPDDPMWMPPGKDHRENSEGVRRYPVGMWTYAGAGPNSRTNQFVLTLQPNRFMGGGSPWEVPLGELVGVKSFETMSQFYTGYGHQKAPGQRLLRQEGYSERVQKEWPLMDSILGCHVVEERE
jgi:cyclophilin family peptidyl-prolyl cis-trans isomerase